MTVPPFGLRMPSALHEKVKASASVSNRSMNAEILARLEQSFRSEPDIAAIVKAAVKEALAESRT